MDASIFRKAMGKNVTGVSVVTTQFAGEQHGMTVNAFLSVSVSPPTMLVSLGKKSRTAELVTKGKVFAVNLLADTQAHESDRFAGRHKDKEQNRFEGLLYRDGTNGCPLLDGALANLECKVLQAYDGGDHTLFVAEVVAGTFDEARSPLVYTTGSYCKVDSLKPLS
jgi:flavin reductase (DIM6/NTAB) family NADH-FMN oxidoreductase RutF